MPEAKKRPYTTAQLTERVEKMQGQLDELNGTVGDTGSGVISVCGKYGAVQLEDEDIPGLVARLDGFDSRLANLTDEYRSLDERAHTLGTWMAITCVLVFLLGIAVVISASYSGLFARWGW